MLMLPHGRGRASVAANGDRNAQQQETSYSAGSGRPSAAERRLAVIVATLGFLLLAGLTARHPVPLAVHAPKQIGGTAASSTSATGNESTASRSMTSSGSTGQPDHGHDGSGGTGGLGGSAMPSATPAATGTPSASSSAQNTSTSSAASATSGPARTSGDGFSLDPKQWVIDALGAAFSWMVSGITSALTDLLKQALDLNILVQTPPGDTYQNGVVLAFWRTLVAVADAALALIVCWAGYNSIIAHGTGGRYHEARQVIPRVALAALGINLSLLVAQTLIDLNNALCGVVSDPFARILSLLALNGANGASGVAFFVLFLTFGIVGLLLVVQMVVRLAMLDVLIVTAPLGLVCWALPQTHAWAQLWTRAFVSTVFVQFLQVLALTLGGGLIAFFPSVGLFAALMDLIVGLATLYLTLKIPSFLRSLGGPTAPNPLSDAAGVAGTALLVARLAALAAV